MMSSGSKRVDERSYRLVEARSALNRVEGMPFRWSLNPYRGCPHDCVYCYARATHAYYDLGPADFARVLFVKTNLPERLGEELRRPSWRRETVAIGTATDPYQPVEGTFRITRRCLEVCSTFRTPVSLVTKGTLVLRDLDVLRDLTERAGATVCFSVPTVDREIWRRTEPGTPPPAQRLKVMERLVAANIRAGVLMAPLLPGLSADPGHIQEAVRAAADHGARFVGADLLHLDPGIRGYYDAFLDREYPELKAGYRRLYGGKYAPKPYQLTVERRVREARDLVGYRAEPRRRSETPREPIQLPLPLPAPKPG
jgi:DNA repair photolyase